MDIDIDFEVFAYGDETNRGRATSIAPSGYVWVDFDSGGSDYISPKDITAVDDTAFRAEFRDAF
ncbi:hypothetical protein [Mycobacteroides abscessus]|uniref:hypothetical protein n=1 Tax=Mycobacteroides abscessus TaxID=36809 RepID=UPI0005E91FC5|nr:hypothetical protein [Mycobacteroides abscessus]CPR73155.1 Uncharacterised protein [Mycobacteroides abscessus]CPU86094.1 Uncharacterised protein [Mycobacteroides abscessus]